MIKGKQYCTKIIFTLGLLAVWTACSTPGKTNSEEELSKNSSGERVTIAQIENGIKDFIAKKTEENNGYFPVKDENHDLKMKLVRVHTEYLSNLGPDSHFACVDLVDVSGEVFDVDFFMEGEPGAMNVTQTTVHKLNGKPFYSWKQKEDKTWYRVPLEQSNNSLLGVVEGSDSFEFYYSVQIPDIDSNGKMWIPIPESDPFQQIELIKIETELKSEIVEEKTFGNKFRFYELKKEDSGQSIELTYIVSRKEKGPYVSPEPDSEVYLASNRLMPTGGRFEEIAKEVLGPKLQESQLIQARALYDYVIESMSYQKYGDYGNGDSNYACDSKTGNCSEFHSFFISLARSVGIPARFAIGASIPSDRNEGGIDGYHCWAEFYADGKWWPIDISEANKYTALATYYFGRHPANRVELSKGRDLMVDPMPDSGPINFIAFPYLEVGGKEVKAPSKFSFTRIKS